ncbi:MAG: hypothetical protein K6E16_08985 [Lachnospiraceae bacterium]|nr:hypothetical protein [Lachnospiraceae bacterium]
MKRFLIVKIWIGLEIVAVLALGVLVVLKLFVWKETDMGPTYRVPEAQASEVDVNDIPLPRDLMVDEYEEETADADADLSAESNTITGNLYETDYPAEVTDRLAEMSVEKKAEYLLITTPEQLCDKDKVTVAGNIFSAAFAEKGVSGLIFSESNFATPASGMEMLKTLRGWSRETTGMNLLLGYQKDGEDAQSLSDRGFNLFRAGLDTDAPEIIQKAAENCMVPAYVTTFDKIPDGDEVIAVIIETDDPEQIVESINAGNTYLYKTDRYDDVRNRLSEAAKNGEILPEALDKASGYAISVRLALTEMRPEEYEKEPPKAAPAKKQNKKLTPEEEAAQALQQLQEQAAKEAQKAQKEAQKAQKEAQKQAEQLQKQLAEQAAAAAAAAAQPAAVPAQ